MGMRILMMERPRWAHPVDPVCQCMRVSGIARSSAPVDPGHWGDIARALRRALHT